MLIQFSPEEMKSCPPFTSDYKWGKVKFLYATSGMIVYMIEDEDGSYMYGDLENPFMCKPEEFSLAITALGQNAAEYDLCMFKKGYNSK